MKLEKVLQSQGFGTRRECRDLIEHGLVQVRGALVTDSGAEVKLEALDFTVRGEPWRYREHAYVLMNKPVGRECSARPTHNPSVVSLLPMQLQVRGVQCVGRLDLDTTGLLLLSDDGGFIHAMTSPKHQVPKVYEVGTAEVVTDAQLQALRTGVQLHDEPEPLSAPAEQTGPKALRVTLTEGKYHQVKRMVAALGNSVVTLHRSSVGALVLPSELGPGAWRYLEDAEVRELRGR